MPWRRQTQRRIAIDTIKQKILVVEDNDINKFLLTRMLSRAGYEFVVVSNGEEAISAYRETRPGLIFMDVQMPVLDGLTATQRIREIERETGVKVPIVATTARALSDDAQRCLDAGMDDYISKPIRLEVLNAKLQEWFPKAEAA